MCLAIPAKIVEAPDQESGRAVVEVVGVRRQIDVALLQDDPPRIGDWVLVHVGFAMSKISEEQARDQLQTLSMLGEEAAAIEEAQGYEMPEPSIMPGQSPPAPNKPAEGSA
jgi:hydrogenase expression/formation protein HypC